VILEPLSGCPSGVRDLADRLTASSRRVGDVTTVLVALKGGATWVSSAGEAFGARLAEAPPLLDAVARRLGGAAVPLREIADAMEEAQRVVEGAIRDDSEAQGTYAVLEGRAYALISAGADETRPTSWRCASSSVTRCASGSVPGPDMPQPWSGSVRWMLGARPRCEH
jgi:hypothetical protein